MRLEVSIRNGIGKILYMKENFLLDEISFFDVPDEDLKNCFVFLSLVIGKQFPNHLCFLPCKKYIVYVKKNGFVIIDI